MFFQPDNQDKQSLFHGTTGLSSHARTALSNRKLSTMIDICAASLRRQQPKKKNSLKSMEVRLTIMKRLFDVNHHSKIDRPTTPSKYSEQNVYGEISYSIASF